MQAESHWRVDTGCILESKQFSCSQVAFLCMSLQEGYSTTPGTPEATTTAPQTTQAPVACPDGWTGFMVQKKDFTNAPIGTSWKCNFPNF